MQSSKGNYAFEILPDEIKVLRGRTSFTVELVEGSHTSTVGENESRA